MSIFIFPGVTVIPTATFLQMQHQLLLVRGPRDLKSFTYIMGQNQFSFLDIKDYMDQKRQRQNYFVPNVLPSFPSSKQKNDFYYVFPSAKTFSILTSTARKLWEDYLEKCPHFLNRKNNKGINETFVLLFLARRNSEIDRSHQFRSIQG